MKIRNGFVSNSSSSSFCIAKCYMTKTQIKKFSEWITKNENDDELMYDSFIGESDIYFSGTISVHSGIVGYLTDTLKIDKKYISTEQ